MSWREIRPVALGAVCRDDELLVFETHLPNDAESFYRLIGGGVEFGEESREAVAREFEEELGVQYEVTRDLGTLEDVFEYGGDTYHEIWRVFEGNIVEDWPYERDAFEFCEPELDETFTAQWVSIETLRREETTFYSPAVLDRLESDASTTGWPSPRRS